MVLMLQRKLRSTNGFRDGREDLEDDPRTGKPTTSRNDENIEAVQNLMKEDRRISQERCEKESPEEEERGTRKEKTLVRELKGLRAQPELQQAFV